MKQDRLYPRITVSKKGVRWNETGHPWVYETDITGREGNFTNGCLTDVFSEKGTWLGAGIYSDRSKITVRILSRNANDSYDEAFFARRVEYAVSYRSQVMGEDFSACRLIFGEADGLPGVTVDKYNDILSVQILSYGMELRKKWLYKALVDSLAKRDVTVSGIFERNDVNLRSLEGLSEYKGWYSEAKSCRDADKIQSGRDAGETKSNSDNGGQENGSYRGETMKFFETGEAFTLSHPESAVTEITENGVRFFVDVENGQKTGFFLDQKYNRREVARLAKGLTVLDCFTHTGSFALNAALGGAKHVTAVDISEEAVKMARKNAERNGLTDRMDFLAADVFDLLPSVPRGKYDFIILDPPAFTKSRKTVHSAEKGYKEINYRAMKALPRGGYLATCSCSHFMEDELFVKMLRSAAKDAGVELKQIEARQQSPDHPILWNVPETSYLKFYIFQIV